MKIKTEKKNLVREKILTCAVKLLEKHGIKKLAQPQIAKDAGVPQGHITYYFPTRADLLLAVADRSMQSIAEKVIQQATKHKGPPDSQSLVPLLSSLLKDQIRTRTLLGLVVESDENEDLRKKLKVNLAMALSLVATTLGRDEVDAEVILTHSALMGLALHHYVSSKPADKIGIDEALALLSKNIKEVKL